MTNETFGGADPAPQEQAATMDLPAAAITLVRAIEILRSSIASDEHIGMTELRALGRLAGHPLTPKQLAAGLGLTTGAVTALTDRLVESGLLARAQHPTDRRSLILDLTPAGEKVMQRISGDFRTAVMDAAADADADEIRAMARLLQETATRMSEMSEARAAHA
jgi:DNA-binding MarR family transcriptional regulator